MAPCLAKQFCRKAHLTQCQQYRAVVGQQRGITGVGSHQLPENAARRTKFSGRDKFARPANAVLIVWLESAHKKSPAKWQGLM
jgi:hypothetical protein